MQPVQGADVFDASAGTDRLGVALMTADLFGCHLSVCILSRASPAIQLLSRMGFFWEFRQTPEQTGPVTAGFPDNDGMIVVYWFVHESSHSSGWPRYKDC